MFLKMFADPMRSANKISGINERVMNFFEADCDCELDCLGLSRRLWSLGRGAWQIPKINKYTNPPIKSPRIEALPLFKTRFIKLNTMSKLQIKNVMKSLSPSCLLKLEIVSPTSGKNMIIMYEPKKFGWPKLEKFLPKNVSMLKLPT